MRRGFTLLEVIVGLALMGSLLVASLLAFSKHRRQLRLADKKLEAVRVADESIDRLSGQPGGIPVPTRGRIAGHPDWIWQTSVVGIAQLATVPLEVTRFQIVEFNSSNAGNQDTTLLVSIELVQRVEGP